MLIRQKCLLSLLPIITVIAGGLFFFLKIPWRKIASTLSGLNRLILLPGSMLTSASISKQSTTTCLILLCFCLKGLIFSQKDKNSPLSKHNLQDFYQEVLHRLIVYDYVLRKYFMYCFTNRQKKCKT